MQYLRLSILSYLLFFSYLYGLAGEKDYVQYVNPLIGTQGDGHCFPGAVRPLGMVQPQIIIRGMKETIFPVTNIVIHISGGLHKHI